MGQIGEPVRQEPLQIPAPDEQPFGTPAPSEPVHAPSEPVPAEPEKVPVGTAGARYI